MALGALLLAVYLLLVGIITLFSVAIPSWVTGLVAFVAGILLLVDGYGVLKR